MDLIYKLQCQTYSWQKDILASISLVCLFICLAVIYRNAEGVGHGTPPWAKSRFHGEKVFLKAVAGFALCGKEIKALNRVW